MSGEFKLVSVLNPTVVLTAGPAISAGTQSQNTGTIAFSNSNGVSFGLNNGTITASVVAGAAAGIGAAAAGTQTQTSGTLNFVNSNGLSFGMSGSSQITASYTVPTQTNYIFSNSNGVSFGTNGSTVTATVKTDYLTTAALSNHSHGVTLNLTNLSGTTGGNSAGINLSLSASPQTAYVFSNSNGVSFGTNGSTVTATVKTDYLTTAALSDHSHGNPTLALTNLSGTTASASNGLTISLSAAVGGGGADGYNSAQFTNSTANSTMPIVWAGNSNGSGNVTIGLTGSTVTMSAPSGGGAADGNNVIGVNGGGTQSATTYILSNANNVSFGLNAGTITASASYPTQTVQPVAASGSNGSFNFSTLSFGGSNGLTFYTTNGSIVGSYTVPTPPTSYVSNVNGSSGALSFAVGSSLSSSQNGSSITWGLASNITTALQSVGAYLTTAAQSNHSHGNPTLNLTNLSGTTASNSDGFTLSLSAAAGGGGADGYNIIGVNGGATQLSTTYQLSNANNVSFGLNAGTITASASYSQSTQPVAVSGSNGSFAFSTLSMGNSNGLLFYTTNGSVVGSYTVPTVPASYVSQVNGSSGAVVFATGSSLSSSQNGSSITFGLASNITTALQSAGAYLTTAAQSNHSHGNPSLNLTNLSGTTASNSAGFTLSLSAAAPGGGGTQSIYAAGNTTQSSSGTYTNALSFAGAGIASVGVTGGSVVVSVPSGGGAGDGYNIVHAGTLGTTGTTWSSLSASVRLNGSNMTVSQNNSNDIVFIAPASSSLVAGANITLSTNGSTVSVIGPAAGGGATKTMWFPYNEAVNVMGQQGQATMVFNPLPLNDYLSVDRLVFPVYFSNASNSTGTLSVSVLFGAYTKNDGTLSLYASTTYLATLGFAGNNNSANQRGIRLLTVPWTTEMEKDRYYVGVAMRSSTAGANATFSQVLVSALNSAASGLWDVASNATVQWPAGIGYYSASTTGVPGSVGFSQIQGTNSLAARPPSWHARYGTV